MAQEPTACPRCGTPNDPRANFCGNCGLTLTPAAAAPGELASDGDRWDVRGLVALGAVAAVVLALGIWQFTGGGDDNLSVVSGSTTSVVEQPSTTTAPVVVTSTVAPAETSPETILDDPPSTVANPATTVGASPVVTAPPATSPATTKPPVVTSAPGAATGAVPGDLGVDGFEMLAPPCDGGYITVLGSAVGSDATADGIEAALQKYADANYLRTDQTCSSLAPTSNGEPIYVIFLGPFATASDACEARAQGPADAYARVLSNEVAPDKSVACPAAAADE